MESKNSGRQRRTWYGCGWCFQAAESTRWLRPDDVYAAPPRTSPVHSSTSPSPSSTSWSPALGADSLPSAISAVLNRNFHALLPILIPKITFRNPHFSLPKGPREIRGFRKFSPLAIRRERRCKKSYHYPKWAVHICIVISATATGKTVDYHLHAMSSLFFRRPHWEWMTWVKL